MKVTDYNSWMERAFIYVEAALSTELATPSQMCMSEDYLRVSLVRGLAYTKPDQAHRVSAEFDVPWSTNPCWHDASHGTPNGRPIQHDVAVLPDDTDAGMICEVKWLKQTKARELAMDIWKLALSRSVKREIESRRTYLLVGGIGKSMNDTFKTIRNNKINIRWSNAGRQSGNPPPREFSLLHFYNEKTGGEALHSLLKWSTHRRKPPECWRQLRLTVRQKWFKTLDGLSWRVCLFEIDHRSVSSNERMPWNTIRPTVHWNC